MKLIIQAVIVTFLVLILEKLGINIWLCLAFLAPICWILGYAYKKGDSL